MRLGAGSVAVSLIGVMVYKYHKVFVVDFVQNELILEFPTKSMPSRFHVRQGAAHGAALFGSLAGFDDDYKSSSLARSLQARC
jgi:hypothetical protein